ncbi:hypothetical protein [Fervidibacillus albus]|uniref:Uncharacterized protein n=1 Tax=Fervidibacillus albus TaxID=2980026 RepID=A0A9E8LTQ8_9BACI|nr:hypothetical protein [Fervidibacillus albus]WAA09026.1 hypothetical protein OE104_10515 [Fervidibacillus albus]
MSTDAIYSRCMRYYGRPVRIRTRDGHIHHGIVSRVSRTHVYLRPLSPRGRDRFGYGYGFWGFGIGLGIGIALGAIIGIALLPWYWW